MANNEGVIKTAKRAQVIILEPGKIADLLKDLQDAITGEVRFDDGTRALYATDGSNYRQVPIGVVLPKYEQDIINTIKVCRQYNVPILSRGGGTSLAGQCCNVAVLMDMSKYYNEIVEINIEKKLATVQPGIVLDRVRHAAENNAGLTFGPDPATHDHCTIGGMLGNNSCGSHSIMAAFEGDGGRTSDNVESLTIITYRGLKMKVGPTSDEEYDRIQNEGGEKAVIYKKLRDLRDKYADLIRTKYPNIPRRISGYNLDDLLPEKGFNVARALVGTESTCVTILEATLKLIKASKEKVVVVIGYKDVCEAGHKAPEILKFKPNALEGLDQNLVDFIKRQSALHADLDMLPPGNGWLMVEFGGDTKEEALSKTDALLTYIKKQSNPPYYKVYDDPEQAKKLWEVRESALGATAWVPGEALSLPGWEDSAVAVDKVGDYLKELKDLFTKYDYNPSVYGHFGQGCVHCSVSFDLQSAEGVEQYKKFTVEAAHLVVKYGGSLSGEHGDGQARGDLLNIMYGEELIQAFREFKEIWDPDWKMNPGKVVNTYGQTSFLRISPHYNPPVQKTHFSFPDDIYSWERVALKCVGAGKCRRKDGGVMCPSYMATMEEEHSTRGRARMLFEMFNGDVLKGGWNNEYVKKSLDLCLSCKGCKSDCPVQVDMAAYKAEFLSHHYKNKLRPVTAYIFGWIYWWGQMASLSPRLANFFMQAPGVSSVVKKIGGIAPQRRLPKFAEQTFRNWFKQREKTRKPVQEKKPIHTADNATGVEYAPEKDIRVILWVDTFNNNFLPQTLIAATEVLETAGFKVIIPPQSLCCGRPLYDYGMLGTAKRMLKQIMASLEQEIYDGVPIVGIEPSCVAVFRDELHNLFPHDEQARRLSKQVLTLAEFLDRRAPDFKIPKLNRKAVVHGHCQHRSVMTMDMDKKILKKTGLEFEVLNITCCGMAGGFGYEKGERYDVSIKVGEHELLPKVRKVDSSTIIIADGFSCREQIEQQTNRKGIHLAQVIQMALREKNVHETTPFPEKKYVDGMELKNSRTKGKAFLWALIFVVIAIAALELTLQKHF